jgi:drug/metabolite transporter (DMT)-like permease
LLGERPGPTAILGLVLVVVGITLVAGLARKLPRGSARGFAWGFMTGGCIAAYTLNDGWAVKVLLISPLLIDYTGNCFRAVVLSRWAFGDRSLLAAEVRQFARPALIVSVLGPLGYILVLFAMKMAPVSHVAPARELATLLGTYFGSRLLNEPVSASRLAGAVCIVGGVVSLALSSS